MGSISCIGPNGAFKAGRNKTSVLGVKDSPLLFSCMIKDQQIASSSFKWKTLFPSSSSPFDYYLDQIACTGFGTSMFKRFQLFKF